MTRLTRLFLSFSLSALCVPQLAYAQDARNFVSRNGSCNSDQYELLDSFHKHQSQGTSVTTRAQQIKSGPLPAQPMTQAVLPAFTPVKCFAETNDLILVLAEEGGNFCGWVPRTALLNDARSSQDDSGSNVFRFNERVCPTSEPMQVGAYCRKADALGFYEPLCDKLALPGGGFADNPIDTKFLTWNAYADTPDERASVAIYDAPNPAQRTENDLSVFSVFKVWDVALGPDDELYTLIGPDQKSVEGWVKATSGTVWFSRLTTFFNRLSDSAILTSAPGTSIVESLAMAPPNLGEMLDGREDFDKYPVLVDNRILPDDPQLTQQPHLKIAFIGTACGNDQLCSTQGSDRIIDKISLLDAVDTLFVMDATKSMQDYFPIVAEEVAEVALARGSSTKRFGAVMYGDFDRRGATGLNDSMQIKTAVDLTEIFDIDEFSDLLDEPLFIKDALKDRPEAAFTALYKAIEIADWRDEALRIVVHIADHGDRANAPQALVDRMRAQNILYIPIAVRGEFIRDENAAFARQSQQFLDRLTVDGAKLGMDTIVTYDPQNAQSGENARTRIRQTLRGATELQDVISEQIASILLSGEDSNIAESNRYPPGYAQLVAAAGQIYDIDLDNVQNSAEARTLAAEGFIAVNPQNSGQDWDYFAAIDDGEVDALAARFKTLCTSMHDTGAAQILSDALRDIIEILTGDVLSNDNATYFSYFDERDKIPLVTQTILGDGIMDLAGSLNSFSKATRARVEVYRKEACRTHKLLTLIDSNLRVDRPFDVAPDGSKGDLGWNEQDQEYIDHKSRKFIWTRIGIGNVTTIYLPLSYLPRPYAQVSVQ